MKAVSTLAIAAALVSPMLFAAPAHAAGWYGKISVGQAFNTDAEGAALADDITYGAALGTSVGPFRLEAGADRISADTNVGGTTINASAVDFHAALFLDLPVGDNVSLFGGAGVDYLQADVSTTFFADSGEGTGYRLTGGASYRISDRITAEVAITQINADLSFDTIGDVQIETYTAKAGIRFAF